MRGSTESKIQRMNDVIFIISLKKLFEEDYGKKFKQATNETKRAYHSLTRRLRPDDHAEPHKLQPRHQLGQLL